MPWHRRSWHSRRAPAGVLAHHGGIPLLSRVIDGGAAEISQITGTMNSLRAMAGPKEFLLIADAKLISYGNVTALIKAGTDFIAPAPASR
ncbi:hypothetical protein, partial [Actinacidiphila oryziradicis]|uniref:hypothetical protein n=1 Tax=Actinacidiphila oryziradicis TaxID=2571141 RepID=UPI0023F3E15F